MEVISLIPFMRLHIKIVTLKKMMLLVNKITSKRAYFLKSIPEDDDSLLYFLYYQS